MKKIKTQRSKQARCKRPAKEKKTKVVYSSKTSTIFLFFSLFLRGRLYIFSFLMDESLSYLKKIISQLYDDKPSSEAVRVNAVKEHFIVRTLGEKDYHYLQNYTHSFSFLLVPSLRSLPLSRRYPHQTTQHSYEPF